MKSIDLNTKVVEMKNITKVFGNFKANDNISLTVHKGEVHALLGENGAGKSTLMNMLYGLYNPTSGEIYIKGHKANLNGPKDAIKLGIGMVHQHFMLVEPFTVTQNIILGMETVKNGFLDLNTARQKVLEISKKYGLAVDPDEKIQDITVGMQQRVEILKVLYRGADILILDEPTAVLTPSEIEELIQIIRNLTKEGKTVIIITHKLKEIKAVADYCTIIRKGKYIDTVNVSKVCEEELAAKMVGREIKLECDKKDKKPGNPLLKIENLCVKDNRGLLAVNNLSLEVREGEILGIAGVDGNGQKELIEAITGLRKVESGKVYMKEEDITNKTPREVINRRISCIPQDRQKRGLVLDFSIEENMILENFHKAPFSKNGILQKDKIKDFSDQLIENFDIRPQDGSKKARVLSGGNQQKVILAREISNEAEILIAAQPTRGLDVGAIEYIHKCLIEQRDKNKAVLFISLELDEVMDVSDRLAVIYEGKIMGIVDPKKTTEKEVGYMMAGGGVDNEK